MEHTDFDKNWIPFWKAWQIKHGVIVIITSNKSKLNINTSCIIDVLCVVCCHVVTSTLALVVSNTDTDTDTDKYHI